VYSRLRFIQCAALVLFGIIIALGVPPLLVTAVRQPPIAGSRTSDGPAVPAVEVPPLAERTSEQPAERRDEAPVPQEPPRQAETKPAEPTPPAALATDDGSKGVTAEPSSGAETAPAKPPTEIQQAATPSPDWAQPDETKGLKEGVSVPPAAPTSDDGSKAATADVPSRPASAPKLPEQAQEPVAPSPESMRKGDVKGHDQAAAASAAAGETGHVARTPMATRARVSAAKKKAAHADRSAKPSNEGAKSVRRPADALKDIPVSAYAADGTQRRIVIRPTSVQDVYYYSRGRSAPPTGADGAR
jgi:hypothetical protein